ncbi:TIGR04063 family PEP-CTERM/XrtA system glycosyltransferase [Thauera humireducens]|uniref:TIGR04063 family PEP-CTERM/XrtA system glycosyltransferase n=1 Tax=Thauera humireducens TaxID=1134435 RepID=UPI00311FD210
MRILHILDHSLPLHSGYTFRTAAILREQRALSWGDLPSHDAQAGFSAVEVEEADGLRFYRTPAPAGTGLLAQMRLTARRIDQLVEPAARPPPCPLPCAQRAAGRVGRAKAAPARGVGNACLVGGRRGTTAPPPRAACATASRALESFALRHADQVTTICEGLRGDIQVRGIPADKITVIPNAVDANAFQFGAEPDAALRSELGLDGCTVLGFAGSFYGYEGLDQLVAATARLAARDPIIRLLLVGGGVQEANLRRQTADLGIADRVIFTGRVPHSRVQKYYELIDVLAYPRLPIRLTELVTPLKPLEAMAQGRMFVASDVGGHRELVRHGETGFLCQAGSAEALADAIADVLAHRERWPAIRRQARDFVERERTWANSVAATARSYRRALASRGRESILAEAN